jgi:hypothetical protein
VQRRPESGLQPSLIVMKQTALVYFSHIPSQQDILEKLANIGK